MSRKIESHADLNELSRRMGALLGPMLESSGICFTLLLVPFGGPGEWCSYISSGQRDMIIKMLRQCLDMLERTKTPEGTS